LGEGGEAFKIGRDQATSQNASTGGAAVNIAWVRNRPEALAAITRSLSNANVEITQAYSTTFPESDEAVIVLTQRTMSARSTCSTRCSGARPYRL
jgi:UTP:GlnB (protein PII) uridylyltransferase